MKTLEVKNHVRTTISVRDESEIMASACGVENDEISIVGEETVKQLGILKLGENVS